MYGDDTNVKINKSRYLELEGPTKVWILTAVIASTASVMAWQLRDLARLDGARPTIHWALLSLFVYLAELTVIHLRLHRHAHSFSMGEVPTVLGLFMVPPIELLLAHVVGNGIALIFNRRQPPIKLAFNLSQYVFVGSVAIVVFRAIIGAADALGPRGWLAAAVGVQASVILANFLINGAINLVGGSVDDREQKEVLAITTLAGFMNTSLALIAITIVWTAENPSTAFVAIVPPIILFFAYRAYLSQRTERNRLESLYQATRVLHESPQIESALAVSAEYARSMFEAEFVEIVILPEDVTHLPIVCADGPDDRKVSMQARDLGTDVSAWQKIAEQGHAVLLRDTDIELLNTDFAIEDAVAAPLRGDHGVFGVILIANQLGDMSQFGETDVRLLDTFAAQVSVSLENGRLEDSLAQLTDLKEELKHQATHDALTKLANRSLFAERVEMALDRLDKDETFVAVLFLDLDDFKTVNDSLGHAAGDELLIQMAERLRQSCRPDDVVARLGGDEFAILLEELLVPSDGTDVAERIIESLHRSFAIEGKDLTVHSSIGIAFGGSGELVDQLLRNADAAMYAAKTSQKGTFRIFEDAMHSEMIRRLELRSDLSKAVIKGELNVVYQPIVDLASGKITGFEALVRWDHPTRGTVQPNSFIAFAEETGLIVPIGRYVLEQACKQLATWSAEFPDRSITVSVNLSPRQLVEADATLNIATILAGHDIPRDRLVLEITETVLMTIAGSTLDDLKSLGIRFAIDDFGTGYSSLSYLDRLPIDIIKIDKSFVDRLTSDQESPLVRTVLQIGQSLGLDTVVEGVETEHQLSRLQELGCAKGQGYLLAKPMDAVAAHELLTRGNNFRLIPERAVSDRGHLRIIS